MVVVQLITLFTPTRIDVELDRVGKEQLENLPFNYFGLFSSSNRGKLLHIPGLMRWKATKGALKEIAKGLPLYDLLKMLY